MTPRTRNVLRGFGLAAVLALFFHIAHGQLGLGGHSLDTFTHQWLYDAIVLGGAVSCLARAATVKTERLPWLLIGIGLAFNASGEIYYSLVFGNSDTPPIPSVADALYLSFYPCAYAGFILLVRARIDRFRASTSLDGAIAATTSAAVIAAIAFEPIVHGATNGGPLAVATTLAYPVCDLILLAIAVGVFALAGWRPGGGWIWLVIGLVLWAVADTTYAAESAKGTYVVGGILDSMWLGSAVATGFAAWQPAPNAAALHLKGTRLLIIPTTFALVSVLLLIYGGFHHIGAVGLTLAGITVVLVIGRAAWTFHENVQLLEASQLEAVTDALTGLGNRRQMQVDLGAALADGPAAPRAVLLMFDLDGFKMYNDQFGHMAGDTMLAHLGQRLREAVAGIGSAFRLGGDEFCVLLRCDPSDADPHIARVVASLRADGEGFSVGASHGVVQIPAEAESTTFALRLADDRMYAKKGRRRGSAREQTQSVLLGLLKEREPNLHEHLRKVGELAANVALKLGMDPLKADDVRRAAELHDIGKAAIPDAILNKPGPLDEHEWVFMRRHTFVGERILAAAPALAGVASLVRSSHERWDGNGYPDGLAGDRIPFGARIIAVCDAFDAITSDRPYAKARSSSAALAELRRESGRQFDAAVVEAFVAAWEEQEAETAAYDWLDAADEQFDAAA